jgi:hypothetical protein
MNRLFLFLTLCLTLFSYANATQRANSSFYTEIAKEIDEATGKIYLHPENIVLEKESILLFHNGYAIPLETLHSDSKGIYIKRAAGECWNGHPIWCNYCKGCGVLWCPAHCRCF